MKIKIKRTLSLLSICLLVFTALSIVMVYAGSPEKDIVHPILQHVLVTNTDPIPVEITDSTLDVTLDEPIEVILDEPIEVTEKLDPFQIADQETWNSGPQSLDFNAWEIPAGKMLVIEYVSAELTTSGGGIGNIQLSVRGVYAGDTQLLHLGRCEGSTFSGKAISKEVKFYCDPETDAGFSLAREVEIQYQTFTFYYTVTGYFIDVS
ncbi:MAG: hypothetical protein NWF10_03210 [Candidatus Bathyarchaeota archaeon]|nr:hypothetical protein [Candidatus Bathyarchaeota archaeon]